MSRINGLRPGGASADAAFTQALYSVGPGELTRASPSSPSIYDDEFNEPGNPGAAWALWDENNLLGLGDGVGPIVDEFGLNMRIDNPGTVGKLALVRDAPPSGDFAFYAFVQAHLPVVSAAQGVGLFSGQDVISAPTTAVGSFGGLYSNSQEVRLFAGSGQGYAGNTLPGAAFAAAPSGGLWLRQRVYRGAGAIGHDFSLDGVAWAEYVYDSSVDTPVAKIGIGLIGPFGGTSLVGAIFRSFRVVEGTPNIYDKLPSATLETT